jgi:regulator of RNase E activity RraA
MLKRWNTPSVYNGWEQITAHDFAHQSFNLEETTDFMPQMGPMIGYAVTLKIEPDNPSHPKNTWADYREYIASLPSPKIVVAQDLNKPMVFGSFWGEVTSNIHRALGCVGTITDGAIRDLGEMTNVGFKAIARRLCIGHAHVRPVDWNCEVEVFGCKIQPGQLIHADKHGFLAIPPEDEKKLLEAVQFMDALECKTMIPVGRFSFEQSVDEKLLKLKNAEFEFDKAVFQKFGKEGEW